MFIRYIKKTILRISRNIVSQYEERHKEKMPVVSLQTKHLRNTQLITDRIALLKKLNKGGIVAEVGVDEGEFSRKILDILHPRKLYLIDIWGSDRYNEGKAQKVYQTFKNYIQNETLEIRRGFSTSVLKEFSDEYFDLIYIDSSVRL